MSILTLDPLGSAPGAPCAAPGFRELRGGRRKTSSHLIAWIGVIAALALVATTLPAQAQARRGILRKGINRGMPAPSFVPRYPTQGTSGPVNPYNNMYTGGYLNNGVTDGNRRYYNGGYLNSGYGNGSVAINGGTPINGNVPGSGGYINGGVPNGTFVNTGIPNGTFVNTGLPNGNFINGGLPSGQLRSGIVPGNGTGGNIAPDNNIYPNTGTPAWQSHLQTALQELRAAQQAMQAQTPFNVVQVKGYLVMASHEIEIAKTGFTGQRHKAMVDIQNAASQLGLASQTSQAIGLTADAINNIQACLQ